MDGREFSQIRHLLGKTQKQLAQLLGVSPKAIQSFEQGWRNVSAQIERQVLFLLYLKRSSDMSIRPCWEIRSCPIEIKGNCPAWQFKAGHLCWFINGTICEGEVKENWQKKIEFCRQCEVFQFLIP
jgi:DNA-binding XRE family transcriptional regulator